MLKEEFEKLYGHEVSDDDYRQIIEPMYMATNLDKLEFVKCIDKKRFALKSRRQLVNEMRKIATHLYDTFLHYTDYEAKERLEQLAKEYVNRFCYGMGYYIHEEILQSCYYPTKIEIFDEKNGHTLETIDLGIE